VREEQDGLTNIGELLYERILTNVSWEVFSRVVVLEFDDEAPVSQVTFRGVHAVLSQQNAEWDSRLALCPECEIQYAEISDHSEFLERFIDGRLGLDARYYIHDDQGRVHTDSGFVCPYHFTLVCDAGHLDIVFRECEIERRNAS